MLFATSAAATDFEALQALISCVSDPAPTGVLSDLMTKGSLVERTGPGDDDDYCWSLAPALHWEGLTFTGMCVVVDDAEEVAIHPDLYWMGSTAPWTEVWLVAPASTEALRAWADTSLPDESRFEIDSLGQPSESALSCSEWHFPLTQ